MTYQQKTISNFDNYIVYSDGRVYSNKNKIILTPINNGQNYLKVQLWNDQGVKRYYLHRLVAQAFIPNPENKPFINHIDNNPLNNDIFNLEWVTNKENCLHSAKQKRMGRKSSVNGENNPAAKLKESDVKKIRQLLLEGKSHRQIAKMFEVSKTQITNINLGKSWVCSAAGVPGTWVSEGNL